MQLRKFAYHPAVEGDGPFEQAEEEVLSGELTWLPKRSEWAAELPAARLLAPGEAIRHMQGLAQTAVDFIQTAKLDKAVQACRQGMTAEEQACWPRLRLALLGSSTMQHLVAGIRVGALRRGLLVDVYVGEYGQYRQEIAEAESGVRRFAPEVLCLCLDAEHCVGLARGSAETGMAQIRACWEEAQRSLGCTVVQQTILPLAPPLLGNNEFRWRASPATIVQQMNYQMREYAEACGVALVSVDAWAAKDGVDVWHDRALWNRSKQEIHPRVSPLFGDQVGRVLAAVRGQSKKCLVLDLDNTLWGGVVGDDGVDGLVLGQGSAEGEAFLAVQRYALQLAQRGVLLAVCSKNDEANAVAAFEQHPEMVLRREDILCFVANWTDKASNLRGIAKQLNVGLDSLVFLDDNPAERDLVRRELPMVAVPELPADPADYVSCLAEAGYFESLYLTEDDRVRAEQYRSNTAREALRETATDLSGYLQALKMELVWSRFDEVSLPRIVQLINKTNQFNLTTQRYTGAQVADLLDDTNIVALQLRLLDAYGDNGVIGVVIGRVVDGDALAIDSWLMSCRVLGRGIEEAALNLLAETAVQCRCTALMGVYRPTAKNGMVAQHYARLGFTQIDGQDGGESTWRLALADFVPRAVAMRVVEGRQWKTQMSIAS